ncbi:15771_t:CDS:2 [Funneliformis geosporum]|nr:15771_t:CDS:2 [Funneliformis geosporum]
MKMSKAIEEASGAAASTVEVMQDIGKFALERRVTGEFAKGSIKVMGNVADAVGTYLPVVLIVSSLVKEIVELYENVQYNKRTCGILVNRVEAAETAIKALMRQSEDNLQNFCKQSYYDSFLRFVNCLKQIKKFCVEISNLSKFKNFVTSGAIKDNFEKVIGEFNECSDLLNLAISVATKEQMDKDFTILQNDIVAMKKFLDDIEGGVTSIDNKADDIKSDTSLILGENREIKIVIENIQQQNDKIMEQNRQLLEFKNQDKALSFGSLNDEIDAITSFNKQVNEQSSLHVEAKRINASEIQDPPEIDHRKGSRVIVQKKMFNAVEVACKPIATNNVQKIQKHLAILGKLDTCPYIIKFHGVSELPDKKVVMVFEWAERGTLKEVYTRYKLGWEEKITIARDICRGLAFLHAVEILHHDIRCENVLMTEKMQPKLCNFKFAREVNAVTSQIDDMNAIIHWLAPEKLISFDRDQKGSKRQEESRYTIQCEIFSFGMTLWELAFEKIPYKNKSMVDIQKSVSKGGRESLEFGLTDNPLQTGYGEIIKLAWQQEPSLRPGIQPLFNMMNGLYQKYVLNIISPVIRSNDDDNQDDLTIPDLELSNSTPITPILTVKEGLQAHKAGQYEKAWGCFKGNADVGDVLAKYWCGYYYLEGRHVEKNKKRAMELFKEAADAGNADAQLRYAFCLIDKENQNIDSKKFMEYLKLAADNKNPTALYNLGDVYFSD